MNNEFSDNKMIPSFSKDIESKSIFDEKSL